jgi:LPXTG-motif cell wall-anchored protein
VTTEKVVDIGPIEINKQQSHPVQWSPILGVVLIMGGVVLVVKTRNN